ncbi:spore coat protein U-like protein [Raoultella ornithinolytica]|jgi:spore coat protein U-like protein|uniref:Spore coat protein U-like protein n=2 Tax=Raoultella TaxID=160674 RepID=A0ABD7QJW8_RAOOR|nr:spore coat U domain-containing protein [Raoultella terrigena]ROR98139.1 spore coat protein U-like protein [Raoultella terrigena]TCQ73947.1 spore coat protein U-like protein [Raoultella ornithinolytica]
MNVKTITGSVLGGLFGAMVVAHSALAADPLETGTLTGQVGVQLTIGAGCTVTNGTNAGSTNSWGTIDFGSYSDLSYAIDAGMIGSGGSSAITIKCSTGINPQLTLNGGAHGGSGPLRYMENEAATQKIAYRLYSDSARQNPLLMDTAFTVNTTGGEQEIPIFARILPEDQSGVTAPAAGLYQDMVIATLTW